MRSKIASKIHNETPESIKNEVREMANAIVFDANTFGPDEVPVEVTDNTGFKYGYTEYVIIDVYGKRDASSYHIGWFDHEEYEWRFKDGSHCPIHSNDAKSLGLHWSFLPLAIYDTNPELRKTIKL